MRCSTEVGQKASDASAVVADIVAVVQNQGRDIMNFWSEEKLTLEDRSKTSQEVPGANPWK